MEDAKIRILFIEDDRADQIAFQRLFKTKNPSYNYTLANSVTEAKKILNSKEFDIVITDYSLGDGTAFDVIELIQDTPVIITTGVGDEEIAVKAMKNGACDYLIKDMERNYLKMLSVTIETAINRKRAEDQFRILSHAIMSINDSIYITDLKDRITFVNETFLKTYGYEESEIIGKKINILYSENNSSEVISRIVPETLEGGWQGELINRRKTGTEFPVFLSTSVVYNDKGQPAVYVGVAKDITKSKLAEAKLQYRVEFEQLVSFISTQFINLPLERIDDGINGALGIIGRFSDVDRSYLFQFSEDSANKLYNTHQWHADGIKAQNENLLDFDAEIFRWCMQKLNNFEMIHIQCMEDLPSQAKAEKEFLKVQGIKSLIMVPMVYDQTLVGFMGCDMIKEERLWTKDAIALLRIVVEIFVNALMRKKAGEKLAAERNRLAVTLRSIADGVITTNTRGEILLINKVAEALTGWKEGEVIGKDISKIFNVKNEKTGKKSKNLVEAVIKTGDIVEPSNSLLMVTKDNNERKIAQSAAPIRDESNQIIGVVLVFRDVTQKQKIDEELNKMQRLESVGILAGGIAHDFNNILTVILGNISLTKNQLSPNDKIAERLSQAEKACLQAQNLTQQLLTFSIGGSPVKKIFPIADLVEQTVSFALRGSNVRCDFIIPKDIWAVEADEGQINQVFNNLVINAIQAMPQGGVIHVECKNVTIGEERAENGVLLKNGRYVKISLKDKGIGIPPEYISQIFDPFFTTKQKGNGLGLSTSYSIIQKHEGCMTVESKLGMGTTFYIYLPASSISAKSDEEGKGLSLKGQGKILIMDDEEFILNISGEMLREMGYEVGYAKDGQEAITTYKEAMESGTPFDAVIMDLTIPGRMGGKEAIQKLKEIHPEIKAVVSSGYSGDPIMAEYDRFGFSGVLAKPYRCNELSNVMNEVIHKDNPEPTLK